METAESFRTLLSVRMGEVSAHQSRLSSAVSYTGVIRENVAAAYAKVTEVDYAQDLAALVETQIRLVVISALHAQINQPSARVRDLLRFEEGG
jgi:flagellin-like hook-associated protein FlgL